MSKNSGNMFNSKALGTGVARRSMKSRVIKFTALFAVSLCMTAIYFWIYTSVLGLEPPKTMLLKKENARWCSKVEVMNRQLDEYDEALSSLQMRDDDIYRSIFGMDEVAAEVRNAGFGGVNRYAHFDGIDPNGLLKGTAMRLYDLTNKIYIQSKSFDECAQISKKAGNMASCIPAISPVNTDKSKYRLTSTFGYRPDPKSGRTQFHKGVDFAMDPGNPVYATGDGVVESISFEFFGYGNSIVIDHGFGYRTRYAHLKSIALVEGMSVKRGECIGLSGNSGKSTGPHLHYEVLYKDRPVNPYNYYDLSIAPEEYSTMVQGVADASHRVTLHPSHR